MHVRQHHQGGDGHPERRPANSLAAPGQVYAPRPRVSAHHLQHRPPSRRSVPRKLFRPQMLSRTKPAPDSPTPAGFGQVFLSKASSSPRRVSHGAVVGEAPALVDHQRREIAGGDHADVVGVGARARRSSGRRCPRPALATPKTIPDCSASTVFLAITVRGRASSTLRSWAPRRPSASREISIPGAIAPPTYWPGAADDVEGGRGAAEVDHDRRSAELGGRGERVDDPVGADLARVVHQHRYAGAHAGLDHDRA